MVARWPLRTAPFWDRAPFFHFLLPLVLAIICYDRTWLKPGNYWGPATILLLGILLLATVFGRRLTFVRSLFFTALYALVFCFGMWRSQDADIRTRPDWFANSMDAGGACLVKITSPPEEKERIWRMQVSILNNTGRVKEAVCGLAFLNVYKSASGFPFSTGDLLLIPGRWQEMTNSGNPFEVDFKTMNRRRNICHQQFLAPADVQLYRKAARQPPGILARAHNYCKQQLRQYVTDPAAYGLLQAMLLGDETAFDPALRQAYSETGVIHIVSISGSHVGVLFAAVALLLSGIRGRKGSWIRFAAGLFVIWFYVMMAGAPPSALRAALMFSVLAFGTAFAKEPQPLNTLFAAACALLCANPAWLFAVGFQLSFAAVLSIMLFYEPIYRLWPQSNVVLRWLWRGLAASLAAELLTAPLVIYYFHNFPLFFIIANLLAAALLGFFALLGGMLIILLGFFSPLAAALSWMVTLLVQVFNKVIFALQSYNPVSFRYLQVNEGELWLIYCAVVGIAVYGLKHSKRALWAGMAATVLLLLLLCRDKVNMMEQQRIIVYNVSRHTTIEQIRGNRYAILRSDSTRSEDFASRAAHIGWGAWRETPVAKSSAWYLKGKKVLLLESSPKPGDTALFGTDVLIIACPLKQLRPEQLKAVFQPKLVVAGGSQSRKALASWKAQWAVLGLPFHAVSMDGAFVLD